MESSEGVTMSMSLLAQADLSRDKLKGYANFHGITCYDDFKFTPIYILKGFTTLETKLVEICYKRMSTLQGAFQDLKERYPFKVSDEYLQSLINEIHKELDLDKEAT